MSAQVPDLPVHHAVAAVMAQVQAVAKAERNDQQNFNFRGIDAVVNAVGPALRAHGVVVTPELLELERSTVEVGRNRTPMGHVAVTVRYRFIGPQGDHLDAIVPGEAMDSGDKATAKAMSVAFRTALLQGLALPTDEPDPDATSYERTAPTATTGRQHARKAATKATKADTLSPAPAAQEAPVWRDYAAANGVRPVAVLKQLVQTWTGDPDDRPSTLADLDQRPDLADQIRAAIDAQADNA